MATVKGEALDNIFVAESLSRDNTKVIVKISKGWLDNCSDKDL